MQVLGKLLLPGDDAFRQATSLASSNESADPNYAVEQLLVEDPAWVTRATGDNTAITVNLPGNVTLVAVSVHNTNATSAAITSGAGLNKAIVIPALAADGQRLGGWADLVGEAGVTDDQFTITLSRTGGILEVGRIALWTVARDVNWERGRDEGLDRPGDITLVTRLGSKVIDPQDIAIRWWSMTFTLLEDAAMFRALERSAKGSVFGFALVPDELVNDAPWVHLPEPYTERREDPFVQIPRLFAELSGGPPNG